jgi:hypothetical protein
VSGILGSIGSSAFKLAFEISPIVLVGGIIPGGILPIVAITQSASFLQGILSGQNPLDLDDHFAHFQPVPGAELISNQIGTYPFANSAVAANAVIRQPINFSMLMIAPAKGAFGFATKLATMIAMKMVLNQHISSGGTFTVITPSFFQTNCLLTNVRDVSPGQTKQTQIEWQFDFTAPLLTINDAQSIMSSLMNKISGGSQIDGAPAWSNASNVVGNADVAIAPSVVPATTGLPAATVAPNIPGPINAFPPLGPGLG